MSAALQYPHRHSVSATEYLRMGEIAVFAPDARLELIEGEIIEMAPIGSPHAGTVIRLLRMFVQRAGDRAVVSVQGPAVISAISVPQPDVALLKPRADDYTGAHPTVADVLLVVEVADTSLGFDLNTKVPMYARSAVLEVWVIDVNERVIRVFRDPSASGYRTSFTAANDDLVESLALPEVRVGVREIFP